MKFFRQVPRAAFLPILAAAMVAFPASAAVAAQSVHRAPAGAAARSGPVPPAPSAPDSTPGPGAVTGTITGQLAGPAGLPLPGGCVTAVGAGGRAAAFAGAGGRYVLAGLRPGSYTLTFADCAHPGRYLAGGGPVRVTVGAGQQVTVAPVRLVARASTVVRRGRVVLMNGALVNPASAAGSGPADISGLVTDLAGHALSGIWVCAVRIGPGGGGLEIGITTGTNGKYDFGGLPSGPYQVGFANSCSGNPSSYAPQWWQNAADQAHATTLQLKAGQHVTGINARLGPDGEVSGTVRLAGTKALLAGVCVAVGQFLTDGGSPDEYTQTAADGSFTLHGLGTGTYHLEFLPQIAANPGFPGCGSNGNYMPKELTVAVTAGQTSTVAVTMDPGGEISGTVTKPGGLPLAGACVLVSGAILGFSSLGPPSQPVVTAADGSYQVTQLPPGRYTAAFAGGCGSQGSYAPQFFSGTSDLGAAASILIGLGQVRSGVDAALAPGGTLTGTVTSAARAPLSDICVQALTRQEAGGVSGNLTTLLDTIIWAGLAGQSAVTAKGGYAIQNLAPGLYYVDFADCANSGARWAEQWYRARSGLATASLVSVVGGHVTRGVNAALVLPGSITGTVTDTAGRKLTAFCASATPVPALFPGSFLAPFGFIGSPGSPGNRGGVYRLNGLAPGNYLVRFSACFSSGGSYATQWYPNRPGPGTATLVRVASGHVTTGINDVLARAGRISGLVTSGVTGLPLPGACVFALDSSFGLVAAGVSGQNGRYSIPGLAPGGYQLLASQCIQINPVLGSAARARLTVVRSGAVTTAATFRLAAGGTIAGTITAGSPAVPEPGMCAEARPVARGGSGGLGISAADGSYSITGLAAGSYRVIFTPFCLPGNLAVAPSWFGFPGGAMALVKVSAGQVTAGVSGHLAADGGISGTVTKAPAVPLAGACVTAVPLQPGGPAGSAGPPGSGEVVAVTGASGGYSIGGLLPGRYRVEFGAGCGLTGYKTQWWHAAATAAAATIIVVPPASVVTAISATLHP